ncbi:MAG: DoxX family protein [Deltaproteobacteria bacterium]|nr:DoxX family protein [Nannocystaceae bacterium]
MVDRRAWLRFASVWAARIVVAGVFIVAATPKIDDLVGFAADIRNYQVFPEWSLHVIAATVPMIELLAALALVSGRERVARAGAIVLGGLTVAFIGLIASVIVRGIDLQCGCFGKQDAADAVGWPTLVRDVALLAGIAIAMLRPRATAGAPAQA